MRTIIAGTRTFNDYSLCKFVIKHSGFRISEVVCGGAQGADNLGKRWAQEHNIPVKVFKADWDKHGKSAGPIRNKQMSDYADALILIWDGQSRGSLNMKNTWESAHGKDHFYEVVIYPTTS